MYLQIGHLADNTFSDKDHFNDKKTFRIQNCSIINTKTIKGGATVAFYSLMGKYIYNTLCGLQFFDAIDASSK